MVSDSCLCGGPIAIKLQQRLRNIKRYWLAEVSSKLLYFFLTSSISNKKQTKLTMNQQLRILIFSSRTFLTISPQTAF